MDEFLYNRITDFLEENSIHINEFIQYAEQKQKAEEKQKQDEKIKRLETIIYNLASYLLELNEEEFKNFKHNQTFFDITKAEHKKYFLGK